MELDSAGKPFRSREEVRVDIESRHLGCLRKVLLSFSSMSQIPDDTQTRLGDVDLRWEWRGFVRRVNVGR